MKIIDDCDILKERIPIHVGRLQSQDNCFKRVVLKIGDNSTQEIPGSAMSQEIFFLTPEVSTKERCTTTKVSLSADHIEGEKYMTTSFLNPHHCKEEKKDVDFRELCHDIVTTTSPKTTTAITKTTTMTDRQLSEDDGSMIRVPVWLVVAVAGNKSCCFFCHDHKH